MLDISDKNVIRSFYLNNKFGPYLIFYVIMFEKAICKLLEIVCMLQHKIANEFTPFAILI